MKSDEFPKVQPLGEVEFSAKVADGVVLYATCDINHKTVNRWSLQIVAGGVPHTLVELVSRAELRRVLDGLYAAAAALVADRNIAEWSQGITIEHREPDPDEEDAAQQAHELIAGTRNGLNGLSVNGGA